MHGCKTRRFESSRGDETKTGRWRWSLAVLTLLFFWACDDAPESDHDDPGEAAATGTGEEIRAPTYHGEIRAILNQHCVECHDNRRTSNLALDSYENVSTWAQVLRVATEGRTMPPFAVNNHGSCNTFLGSRWLDESEIDIIGRWIDGGVQLGDTSLPPPKRPDLQILEGPDVAVLQAPLYTPPIPEPDAQDNAHLRRCFAIPLHLVSNAYIVAYQVHPGFASIVHHVVGYRVTPTQHNNAENIARLADQSPEQPGWNCPVGIGEGITAESMVLSWGPGSDVVRLPHQSGTAIGQGDVLVLRIHYDLSEFAGADQTRLRLQFADSVQREAVQALGDSFDAFPGATTGASLPPGQKDYQLEWSRTVGSFVKGRLHSESGQFNLLGVLPHMRERGRRMEIRLRRAQVPTCVADVDRYDTHWQHWYLFEHPLTVSLEDELVVRCSWSTLPDSEAIGLGPGAAQEMCSAAVLVSQP